MGEVPKHIAFVSAHCACFVIALGILREAQKIAHPGSINHFRSRKFQDDCAQLFQTNAGLHGLLDANGAARALSSQCLSADKPVPSTATVHQVLCVVCVNNPPLDVLQWAVSCALACDMLITWEKRLWSAARFTPAQQSVLVDLCAAP